MLICVFKSNSTLFSRNRVPRQFLCRQVEDSTVVFANCSLGSNEESLFILSGQFEFKVCFVRYYDSDVCLLPGLICSSFHSNMIRQFKAKICFLKTIDRFCFLVFPVSLYLVIRELKLRPLILKIIVEMCVNGNYCIVDFHIAVCVLSGTLWFNNYDSKILCVVPLHANPTLQPTMLLPVISFVFVFLDIQF